MGTKHLFFAIYSLQEECWVLNPKRKERASQDAAKRLPREWSWETPDPRMLSKPYPLNSGWPLCRAATIPHLRGTAKLHLYEYRFRTGVAEKEGSCPCCPLCHSLLISIYFPIQDKVNPQRLWRRSCIHPTSTVKGSNRQRKGACTQMQDAPTACSIQKAGTCISCSNMRWRGRRCLV